MGRLIDIEGTQGFIALGIPAHSTLANVWRIHRRRRHQRDALNSIECAISEAKERRTQQDDQALWCGKSGTYRPKFSSKFTWQNLRNPERRKAWSYMVWFQNATPKFTFITWLVISNRLSTGECMAQWGQGMAISCIFCFDPMEIREHQFFECGFSHQLEEADKGSGSRALHEQME
ncbi:uncharacterized protein LOC112085268 [Eutrema salsugineum]|uniref:uncharacterized protein LOC112085268 n=1 Tax=Eutrema salsugineum TaxID=72664 RepID=UPI000CECEC23|nr:uncharacterized protein LOC112085268 [Eutrema salsugineum]